MEEKFILFMKDDGFSENTYTSYARDIRLFKKYYYDSYGENLTVLIHEEIRMYIQFLVRNKYKASSINRKIAAIMQYNLFLVSNGIQGNIVVRDKDYIKIQKNNIPKELPSEQYMNKLKHAAITAKRNSKRDYCMIILFSCGGLRASEMVNLRVEDVHLKERYIGIIGKGNKYRKVIINNLMYDALDGYLPERLAIETKNPYLFIGQKNKNTTQPMLRQVCNRILKKYMPPGITFRLFPHLLRYFFCNHALLAGYTIDQLADQAGHSSLNTTKRLSCT